VLLKHRFAAKSILKMIQENALIPPWKRGFDFISQPKAVNPHLFNQRYFAAISVLTSHGRE